jgi:hypothetical protein
MKLLSRLRDQPGATSPANRAPARGPAPLVYSRDEFLDPSDPAEFEPVVCAAPAQGEPVRKIRAGSASDR